MDSLPPDMQSLLAPRTAQVARLVVPEVRRKMVWEAACSVGARSALARQTAEIHRDIEKYTPALDKMSFQSLISSDGMLPPVITEERDVTKQDGSTKKRSSGVIYRIVVPARLVTVAPTWRDYLYAGLPSTEAAEMPPAAFMPQNEAETLVWKQGVTKCWEQGIQQANGIFDENMNRLERDFGGMIRYRYLSTRNMVTGTKVTNELHEVSGDSQTLFIDDKTTRLLDTGAMIPDSKVWK